MSQAPESSREKSYIRQRRTARTRAVQFLYQIDAAKDLELMTETVDRFWEQVERDGSITVQEPGPAVRALADRFIYGVVENLPELDRKISESVRNWRMNRMSLIDRNILRLAVYELSFCEDIPPKASVNEAIELAKEYGDKDSPRFVNGVLDKLLQDRGVK